MGGPGTGDNVEMLTREASAANRNSNISQQSVAVALPLHSARILFWFLTSWFLPNSLLLVPKSTRIIWNRGRGIDWRRLNGPKRPRNTRIHESSFWLSEGSRFGVQDVLYECRIEWPECPSSLPRPSDIAGQCGGNMMCYNGPTCPRRISNQYWAVWAASAHASRLFFAH